MASPTVPQTSDKRRKIVYVLEERTTHHALTLMDHEYPTRDDANAHMRQLIAQTPAAFGPGGPIRLVVTEVRR